MRFSKMLRVVTTGAVTVAMSGFVTFSAPQAFAHWNGSDNSDSNHSQSSDRQSWNQDTQTSHSWNADQQNNDTQNTGGWRHLQADQNNWNWHRQGDQNKN